MLRLTISALVATFVLVAPAFAIEPFPSSFRSLEIATNGTTLHYWLQRCWRSIRFGFTAGGESCM
jgi:hypothetical protein